MLLHPYVFAYAADYLSNSIIDDRTSYDNHFSVLAKTLRHSADKRQHQHKARNGCEQKGCLDLRHQRVDEAATAPAGRMGKGHPPVFPI